MTIAMDYGINDLSALQAFQPPKSIFTRAVEQIQTKFAGQQSLTPPTVPGSAVAVVVATTGITSHITIVEGAVQHKLRHDDFLPSYERLTPNLSLPIYQTMITL